jgi:hypothetical protein
MIIRSSQAVPHGTFDSQGIPYPLQEQAAEVFANSWQQITFLQSARSALT